MRTVIDTLVTMAFILAFGIGGTKVLSDVKKETFVKVHKGLGSLESFTEKMTSK